MTSPTDRIVDALFDNLLWLPDEGLPKNHPGFRFVGTWADGITMTCRVWPNGDVDDEKYGNTIAEQWEREHGRPTAFEVDVFCPLDAAKLDANVRRFVGAEEAARYAAQFGAWRLLSDAVDN